MNKRTLDKIDELEARPVLTDREQRLLAELNRMNDAEAAHDLRVAREHQRDA